MSTEDAFLRITSSCNQPSALPKAWRRLPYYERFLVVVIHRIIAADLRSMRGIRDRESLLCVEWPLT